MTLFLPRTEPVPAAHEQQRLWLLHQTLPDPAAYNVPVLLRIEGPLDVARLERAVSTILRRHEALRTAFSQQNGRIVQVPAQHVAFDIPVDDLQTLPADRRDVEARNQAAAESRRPFDLRQPPLIRFRGFRLAANDYLLNITIHHIVFDEWSMRHLFRELPRLYEAGGDAERAGLPALPAQYSDYALAQQRRLADPAIMAPHLAYWRERLAAAPSALEVPADRPRPVRPTGRGDTYPFAVDTDVAGRLMGVGKTVGATPFMVWLAAFQGFLAARCAADDLIVGTPVSMRYRSEFQSLIGFFLNTVPIRVTVDDTAGFQSLLRRVRGAALGAIEHAETPFERIVREVGRAGASGQPPLVQVLFVYHPDETVVLRLPGMTVTRLPMTTRTAKFDLSLFVKHPAPNRWLTTFEYSSDLFDAATIHRMAEAFSTWLAAVAARPDAPLSAMPLLPEEERRRVLEEFNRTEAPPGEDRSIVGLFERQAAETPDAEAMRDGETRMTYRHLNMRANQLARRLRDLGVEREQGVGIALPRSGRFFTAALGVLKAGAAYVPLDPAYPDARLRDMAEQSALRLVWVDDSRPWPKILPGLRCLDLSAEKEALAALPPENPSVPRAPGDLLYVLFTSGSTGRPKGVGMEDGALLNLLRWQSTDSGEQRGRRTLQFASPGFDVSFQEVFSTLCFGGTLVFAPETARTDFADLARVIRDERICRAYLPHVALQLFAEAADRHDLIPAELREVITAGEPLQITPSLVRFFRRTGAARLVNQYGPTETHVVSAFALDGDPAAWPARPPIGRPVARARLYILDKNLRPVPVGMPGEMYVGGAPLARGYVGRPELTAERFLADPFAGQTDARMYRTGDHARWRADGNVEFLGRTDGQLKIRGFRVELGEVRAVLAQHPQVRECEVIDATDASGRAEMAAFYVPAAGAAPTVEALREHLRARLPEYMIPARIVPVEQMPLTSNRKVDLRELRIHLKDAGAHATTTGTEPRDSLEWQLQSIWRQVLNRRDVGLTDSFFDLGGHSLLAVELFHQIERRMGRSLSVANLFRAPTIEQLARLLHSDAAAIPRESSREMQGEGRGPPLFYVPNLVGVGFLPRPIVEHIRGLVPYCDLLKYPGIDDPERSYESVEELAADLVRQVRQVLPPGPCALGGYCFGGVVAYEMARQLEAQGIEVAMLLLWESHAPYPSASHRFWRTGRARVRDFSRLARPEKARRIRRFLSRPPWSTLADDLVPGLPADAERTGFGARMQARSLEVYKRYHPGPWKGRAMVFRATDRAGVVSTRPADGFNGWSEFIRGRLEVCAVPGDHTGVWLNPEHLRVVAEQTESCLRRLVDA